MRNPYLKNLNKIEFVITDACTGNCKHCSQGDHSKHGGAIDRAIAVDAVQKIAARYSIKTVMTFGGEPLLYPDVVCAIMKTARELNIPHRQVITNGYFTRNADVMENVARQLALCGVNDLLLSVDAFHQETIPLDAVKMFAANAKSCGIPIRLSPAWLVSPTDDNPYNRKTRKLLAAFAEMNIPRGEGNVVFPEGNAPKYLGEYLKDGIFENPYVEDAHDVRCVSFSSCGDVFGENVYQKEVMKILDGYAP